MEINEHCLLTIAIPTFNRPEKIKKQVVNLIPLLNDEVLLIIIDNHGDIEVSTLFQDVRLPHNVIFIRNRYNIGADANIAKCFELCETQWLWTLSDDDIATIESVDIILNTIKENNNSLMVNFNPKHELLINNVNKLLDNCDSSLYSSLFWMSSCVYNVKKLAPYMSYYYSAMSTMQPGIPLIVKALGLEKDAYVLVKNNILTNGACDGDISWNRTRFVYSSLFLIDLLREMPKKQFEKIEWTVSESCLIAIVKSKKFGLKFRDLMTLYDAVRKRVGICFFIKNIRFFLFYLTKILR